MTEGSNAARDHPDEEAARRRLAGMIRNRRQELRLSQARAAALAQVVRNTWATAESGARTVREHNYAGIERALRWQRGSVQAILAGGEPTVREGDDRPQVTAPTLPDDFDLQEEIDRIERLNIPGRRKVLLAKKLIKMYEQAQAEEDQ